ncbi:MAG TPA: M56 family metallopeptidase [Kofleriaceae bacterium]|nr:M56 family metallopeptidase [Kofleriaceae bacterium]
MADWIATGLVHGTALAAITALVAAALLRRARPALVAALWTVVLLKFLVPIGPRAHLSLSSALDGALALVTGESAAAGSAAGGAAATAASAAGGSGAAAAGWAALAAYLAALATIAARRAARHRDLRRRVRALPLAPAGTAAQLERLARRMGRAVPARLPTLRLSPDASSPYLVGCWRSDLVVPAWLDPASPAWSAALCHELAHLARRDPWMRALERAATALFFFWPPVAWVCRRIDRAREMACDQWALAHGPLSPRDYARLLVELATRAPDRAGPLAPAAMALVRTRSQLGARVDQLLAGARPPRLGRARSAAVAAWAAICLAGAARAAGAAIPAGAECALDPEILAQIMATHPDADTDGDGQISQEEACAHQQRMRQRLVDRVVDAELLSRLEPEADADGDGALSDVEIESVKDQLEIEMSPDPMGGVVLHYGGAPIPLPAAQVRVSAAATAARVCRAGRCADGPAPAAGARGPYPLLIDVSPLSGTAD